MEEKDQQTKPVSLSEVKNILKKVQKEREDLLYEQRIALEHSEIFSKLTVTKTNELIKELSELDFLKENQIFKIADLLPQTEDDIKTIFAKERGNLGENEIKKILEIVRKHYTR